MNSATKTTAAKRKTKTVAVRKSEKQTDVSQSITRFNGKKPPEIPLAIVAIASLYIFLPYLLQPSAIFTPQILMFPGFPALLVSIFSILAIYLQRKGKIPGGFVTGVAWLFIVITAWTLFAWLVTLAPPDSSRCEGFFGAMQNCAQLTLFQTYILFFNPISLVLLSTLAIGGIAIMVVRLKK